MRVLIFGATGMVGSGVLKECLADSTVSEVTVIGRSPTHIHNSKLEEILRPDLFRFEETVGELRHYDACFFCLGVSSVGIKVEEYERLTYDLTIGLAKILAQNNPQMTFVYVTGVGTDSTEKGPRAWARIKGRTENALLALPFKAAYMFRPGAIMPLDGVRSKTPLYQGFLTAFGWALRAFAKAFPRQVLTSKQVGQLMIEVAKGGAPKAHLEPQDLKTMAHAL